MNVTVDLNTVLQALVAVGIAGAARMLYSTLCEIRYELRKMNGAITKLETWKQNHEVMMDERHEVISKNMDAMWNQIDALKNRLK